MSPGVSKTKWNGNGSSVQTEIPNISLDVSLCYEGKRDAIEILATPPASARLIWGREDAENLLYYGDNLPILSMLFTRSVIVRQGALGLYRPSFRHKKCV
jgi:hypothetical protein